MVEAESEPPPDCTCHVTCTPDAGLPSLLLTCTTSGSGSLEPACAVWLSPLTLLMVDGEGGGGGGGGGAVAFAVNVTGEPESPCTDAVAVWVPVVEPRVHSTRASPSDPVGVVEAESNPPPDCTTQLTLTPAAGLPSLLVTFTTSGSGSFDPASAV